MWKLNEEIKCALTLKLSWLLNKSSRCAAAAASWTRSVSLWTFLQVQLLGSKKDLGTKQAAFDLFASDRAPSLKADR